MRILLLNQYVPPDAAPTAGLLGDLAGAFAADGHEVRLLGAGGGYRAGRRGWGRWGTELGAWGALVAGACREPRVDGVVVLSSPAGVGMLGAWLARRHGARLAHWVMDVYPEVAEALGQRLPPGAAWGLRRGLARAYRRAERVVALDGDMAEHLQRAHGVRAEVQAPWPPCWREPGEFAGWPGVPEGAAVWLYSGNLGRAHDWETLLGAQALLEQRGCPGWLVLQGAGAGWEEARRAAAQRGLRRLVCCPPAGVGQWMGSCLRARAVVATQRAEARGLLWPSKLAVLECLDRPLAWVGPREGAIACGLSARPGAGILSNHDAEGLAAWLEGALARNAGAGWDRVWWERRREEGMSRWRGWAGAA